jgi:hypothetical protein
VATNVEHADLMLPEQEVVACHKTACQPQYQGLVSGTAGGLKRGEKHLCGPSHTTANRLVNSRDLRHLVGGAYHSATVALFKLFVAAGVIMVVVGIEYVSERPAMPFALIHNWFDLWCVNTRCETRLWLM